MDNLLRFYKKTGWLWILFCIVFVVMGMYVMPLFYIFIPGLLGYSLYFGIVRGSEM